MVVLKPNTGILFLPAVREICEKANHSRNESLVSLSLPPFSLPPALRRPKQALRCRGSPLVTPSVYRTAQCAGDSNYQQMTVAVPNEGQMAIQGVMRVQLRGGLRARRRVEETEIKAKEGESKGTLGTKAAPCVAA